MATPTQNQLNATAAAVLLQEIPGEVSLTYLVSGCPIGCKGCHSSDSWSATNGEPISTSRLIADCQKYGNLISCVLFMGGEWQPQQLLSLLQTCQDRGLNTALYTGLDYCPPLLRPMLDYVKTGAWRAELGGLNSPATNQRLYDLKRQLCLNPLLWPIPGLPYFALPASLPE